MQGQAVDSITRFNWLHDSVKSGFRIDGPLDVGNTGEKGKWIEGEKQTKGAIYGNAVWNCGTGLMVKGDYHVVAHNTGMGCSAKDISLINMQPEGGNQHSIGRNNAAEAMDGYRGNRRRVRFPLPPLCSHNWIGLQSGASLREVLRDPDNLDFRPAAGSALVDAGSVKAGVIWNVVGRAPDIGAYESGATRYWIPGRQVATASSPVPPDGSTHVKHDADLMWLGGLDATLHDVYLGVDWQSVEQAGRGSPAFRGRRSSNVLSPGRLHLQPGKTFYWRVDAVGPNGPARGRVWSLSVQPATPRKSS